MKVNKVCFTENCISNITEIIERHELITEVGGALVGYQSGDYLIITHASDAGKNAKMSYNSIEIDGEHATNYCNKLNELSDHKLYFLGDWHTHLSDNLKPSKRDIIAMKTLSKYIPFEFRNSLITVIINHYNPSEIKVFSLYGDNKLKKVLHSMIPDPLWVQNYT